MRFVIKKHEGVGYLKDSTVYILDLGYRFILNCSMGSGIKSYGHTEKKMFIRHSEEKLIDAKIIPSEVQENFIYYIFEHDDIFDEIDNTNL